MSVLQFLYNLGISTARKQIIQSPCNYFTKFYQFLQDKLFKFIKIINSKLIIVLLTLKCYSILDENMVSV